LVLDGANTNTDYPDSGVSNPDPTDDDYFPLMDRMGNVTGYRKAATNEAADSLSAVYEYDAFGQEIRSVGPASDTQPYRFSTKYTEGSTGLVYYGFRWYDAGKGRWLNRDPIGEDGGVNLQAIVGNNLVQQTDMLGLAQMTTEPNGVRRPIQRKQLKGKKKRKAKCSCTYAQSCADNLECLGKRLDELEDRIEELLDPKWIAKAKKDYFIPYEQRYGDRSVYSTRQAYENHIVEAGTVSLGVARCLLVIRGQQALCQCPRGSGATLESLKSRAAQLMGQLSGITMPALASGPSRSGSSSGGSSSGGWNFPQPNWELIGLGAAVVVAVILPEPVLDGIAISAFVAAMN
jgi:RHS repeat-associated protein